MQELIIKPQKYTDILGSQIPGVESFFDLDETIGASKQMKKPIMIDFTKHSCANCRKMESEVLSNPEIGNILHKDFIVASLYADEKTQLFPNETYASKFDGSEIKNLGSKYLDLEATIANFNAQPFYVFVDQAGKIIKNAGGYDPDVNWFITILNEVIAENKKRFP